MGSAQILKRFQNARITTEISSSTQGSSQGTDSTLEGKITQRESGLEVVEFQRATPFRELHPK
jgi:hypothetical protein